MSELANFGTNDVAALSPDQRSAFGDMLAKAGFDRSAIDEQLNTVTANPAPSADHPSQQAVFNHPDDALSPRERSAAVETLRAAGVDETAIQNALGGKLAEAPQEYHLQFGTRAELVNADELTALNSEIQRGLAGGGVPPQYAQPLLDAMLNTADLYDDEMSEQELKFVRASEMSALNKLSNANEIIRTASIACNSLPADFRSMMDEHHAFDSMEAYLALSRIGQRIEYDRSKK